MSWNPTPSASLAVRNYLQSNLTQRRTPIFANFPHQTSAPRDPRSGQKFSPLSHFSPNLPTARIQYGSLKVLFFHVLWSYSPPHFSQEHLENGEGENSNSAFDIASLFRILSTKLPRIDSARWRVLCRQWLSQACSGQQIRPRQFSRSSRVSPLSVRFLLAPGF